MDLEDLLALVQVGQVNMDLAVEASGAQKCLIKDVSTVGGGQDDDTAVGPKAVHLGEQLVQRALPLVVGAHGSTIGAGTSHGVDFVDEDDTGCFLLGLTEEVAHAAGTDAHKHLHEIRARHAEEWHVGLAGHSLGQQRLTRARRAYEEGALGNLASQVGIFLGILQELDDFLHLLLGSCLPGHITEGDLRGLVLLHQLGPAAPHIEDAHRPASIARASAAHAAHHHYPEDDNENQGAKAPDKVPQARVAAAVAYPAREVAQRLLFVQEVLQFLGTQELRLHIGLATHGHVARLEDVTDMLRPDIHDQRALLLVHHDAGRISLSHILFELRIAHLLGRATLKRRAARVKYQIAQHYCYDQIEPCQAEARHF